MAQRIMRRGGEGTWQCNNSIHWSMTLICNSHYWWIPELGVSCLRFSIINLSWRSWEGIELLGFQGLEFYSFGFFTVGAQFGVLKFPCLGSTSGWGLENIVRCLEFLVWFFSLSIWLRLLLFLHSSCHQVIIFTHFFLCLVRVISIVVWSSPL